MPGTVRRTIRFTLNDQPVTADVEPHWTLVDLLQRCFDLFGAREELRPRPVRMLHRRAGRESRVGLPLSGGAG